MARWRQRWCMSLALVLHASIIGFAVDAAVAQTRNASGASAAPWPCRLSVIGELRAFAELAWAHSPTFRGQCRKLAMGHAITIVEPVSVRGSWRAQTRIRRLDDGVTMARTLVWPSAQGVELIAHELEHVIEYLEGARFLMESSRAGSRVWLVAGAYETGRAIEAGCRVAEEVRHATTGRRTETTGGSGCRAARTRP